MKKLHWKPGTMLYPVPPVMVSCGSLDNPNIITIAWAGTVCTNPAMVSISVRKSRYSYPLIVDQGDFVINLATKRLAFATDFCGVRSGRDLDKFEHLKLTAAASQYVKSPIIVESPVNIECRVTQVLPLGSHDLILAEVLGVSVDEALLSESGKLELERAGLVAYSHGTYFELGESLGTFGYAVKKKIPSASSQGKAKNPSKASKGTSAEVNQKSKPKARVKSKATSKAESNTNAKPKSKAYVKSKSKLKPKPQTKA